MRDIPTSPRIKEIKRKQRARVLRISILLMVLFAAIIWALSFFSANNHITIDNIVINGNHIINQSDIESQIYKDLSGKYIYLFSRSNSFIYPQKQIYNDLRANFPRIDTLVVNRYNLKTLQIDITERTGSFLYCGQDVPLIKDEIGENCYFINNDGYIFDKAPYFSGNVYFKYYINLGADAKNPLGKQILDVEEFHRIARFIDKITSIGFKPIYIVIGKDGTNNLYLDNGNNIIMPKIIFKNEDDFGIIGENLAAAMKKEEFATEINSKYNTLLYIDLRFNNKVLYKFQ